MVNTIGDFKFATNIIINLNYFFLGIYFSIHSKSECSKAFTLDPRLLNMALFGDKCISLTTQKSGKEKLKKSSNLFSSLRIISTLMTTCAIDFMLSSAPLELLPPSFVMVAALVASYQIINP